MKGNRAYVCSCSEDTAVLYWAVNARDFHGVSFVQVDGWLVAEVVKQKIKKEAERA